MIRIDPNRCVLCGMCAKVCASRCLHITDNGIAVRHEERCIQCGHCTAVCPQAALSLNGIQPDTLKPTGTLPDINELDALIRSRRSIRLFKEDAVPEELLLHALDTVRYAPTGKNLENVQWLIIEGRDALRRVADAVIDLFRTDGRTAALAVSHDRGEDPIFRGAPCAVFACAEGTYALDIVNCSIAVTTLDLMLPVLGLGGCWAGFAMRAAAMDDKVCEAMNVEKGLRPLAGLMIGRPAVHYKRIPERRALRIRTVKGENA